MQARNPIGRPTNKTARCRWRALLCLLLTLPTLGCSQVLKQGNLSFQHGDPQAAGSARGFDFRHSPSLSNRKPTDLTPDDRVVLRYLGAGALYIGWRGAAILTGPFFSNPGLLRVGLGKISLQQKAIHKGLEDLELDKVGAILIGHSHYDHLGDLPILGALIPAATIVVNQAGYDALTPYPALQKRSHVLETLEGPELHLSDSQDRPLPFRIRPILSDHAPHASGIELWQGPLKAKNKGRPWQKRRYGFLKSGQPYAFVIDLLGPEEEGSEVRFRLYYQDSASEAPWGVPPGPAPGEPHYDLAMLCAASAHHVVPAPRMLLRATAPAHVLVTHYENFFRPWGPGTGLAPLLTPRRLGAFLQRVEETMRAVVPSPRGPSLAPTGPSNPYWTIPLVGEWLEMPLPPSKESHVQP